MKPLAIILVLGIIAMGVAFVSRHAASKTVVSCDVYGDHVVYTAKDGSTTTGKYPVPNGTRVTGIWW